MTMVHEPVIGCAVVAGGSILKHPALSVAPIDNLQELGPGWAMLAMLAGVFPASVHSPSPPRWLLLLCHLLLPLNHSVPLPLQPSVRLLWSYAWWQPRIIRLGWRNPKFIYMGKNVWANGQLTRASADGAFEECQPGSLSVAFPAGFKAKVRSANYTLFRISHCILLKME
jgi:hypothetical protein